jgi:hypothetical protein
VEVTDEATEKIVLLLQEVAAELSAALACAGTVRPGEKETGGGA